MDCFKIFKGQFTGTHSFLFDANTLWKKSQFDPLNITHFDWKLVFQPLSGRVHVNLG